MRIASLGSGSKGNATIVATGNVAARNPAVLVDCGFSLKDLQRRAAHKDFLLSDIAAILVTHEHSDHCSGVAALSRSLKIPVYLTHGTYASGRVEGCYETHCFNADDVLHLAGMSVHSVAVPHDAREPVQYVFERQAGRIGILTDLGCVTAHVARAFRGCEMLLLEFNHDVEMLAGGPYPQALKRRVAGDWGHLSNQQALALLHEVAGEKLQHLAIAHISEKNNNRETIQAALVAGFPRLREKLVWAQQESGFDWIELGALPQSTPLDAPEQVGTALASVTAVGAY